MRRKRRIKFKSSRAVPQNKNIFTCGRFSQRPLRRQPHVKNVHAIHILTNLYRSTHFLVEFYVDARENRRSRHVCASACSKNFQACPAIIIKNKQDEPRRAPAAPTAARRQPRTSASQNATTIYVRNTPTNCLWICRYIMGSPYGDDATPGTVSKVGLCFHLRLYACFAMASYGHGMDQYSFDFFLRLASKGRIWLRRCIHTLRGHWQANRGCHWCRLGSQ